MSHTKHSCPPIRTMMRFSDSSAIPVLTNRQVVLWEEHTEHMVSTGAAEECSNKGHQKTILHELSQPAPLLAWQKLTSPAFLRACNQAGWGKQFCLQRNLSHKLWYRDCFCCLKNSSPWIFDVSFLNWLIFPRMSKNINYRTVEWLKGGRSVLPIASSWLQLQMPSSGQHKASM